MNESHAYGGSESRVCASRFRKTANDICSIHRSKPADRQDKIFRTSAAGVADGEKESRRMIDLHVDIHITLRKPTYKEHTYMKCEM